MLNDTVLLNDWHVVARSEDVAEGKVLGERLLGEDLVLWRRGGRALAWQDLCIHRGSRLSLGTVEDDGLMCPYHGWTYNAEGRCVRIPAHPEQTPPAKARVKTYQAQERYGLVWVSLGQPERDVPPFDEWNAPTYRKILRGPYPYHASGPRAIENFLDVAHLPFVHDGILAARDRPQINDYKVESGSDGITASDFRVWQPDPGVGGQGTTVTYGWRVFRPLTTYFIKDNKGTHYAVFFTVTPIEEFESMGWMWVAMDFAHDAPVEEIRQRVDKIAYQDVPVVEAQRPERLPLDLQAELHLRSDQAAIAYRKWLKELGLTFGTE